MAMSAANSIKNLWLKRTADLVVDALGMPATQGSSGRSAVKSRFVSTKELHMEHTVIAQASPDIAPEGVINAISSRIPELKGEKPRFGLYNPTLDGRILTSGVAYWEMSVKYKFLYKVSG
jgi:hypothetical protein